MDGHTALARRLYLHIHNGGTIREIDMERMVQGMEHKDQVIAELANVLETIVSQYTDFPDKVLEQIAPHWLPDAMAALAKAREE